MHCHVVNANNLSVSVCMPTIEMRPTHRKPRKKTRKKPRKKKGERNAK
jgi:hypothetical protein